MCLELELVWEIIRLSLDPMRRQSCQDYLRLSLDPDIQAETSFKNCCNFSRDSLVFDFCDLYELIFSQSLIFSLTRFI